MRLRVIDATNRKPIGAVQLTLHFTELGDPIRAHTDSAGIYDVRFPVGRKADVAVGAAVEGYAGAWVNIRTDVDADPPKQFELPLERGTLIGGIVRNDAGPPIAGATVTFTDEASRQVGGVFVSGKPTSITTGADGRWRSDQAPADLRKLAIVASHPDYLSLIVGGESNTRAAAPSELFLRDMTAVLILGQGIALVGRVKDDTGKPVEGATIIRGQPGTPGRFQYGRSGADGTFRIGHAEPCSDVITASAPGRSPQMLEVKIEKGMPPIEFRLTKGKTLRARVVDPKGHPVPEAQVSLHIWRGRRGVQWNAKTDGEGRFTWTEAPADDVVVLTIDAAGYVGRWDVALRAANMEHVVTLQPSSKSRDDDAELAGSKDP
jgi:hypothetical protein